MRRLISILWFLPLVASCATPPTELDTEVKRLCAQDGGMKVFETVRLPADRFDKFGHIVIPLKKDAKPEDEYYYVWDNSILKAGNPEDGEAVMWRDDIKFYRAKDKKLLGEDISYVRRGGDRPGPSHPTSFRCPSITLNSGIEKLIFLNSTREEK